MIPLLGGVRFHQRCVGVLVNLCGSVDVIGVGGDGRRRVDGDDDASSGWGDRRVSPFR